MFPINLDLHLSTAAAIFGSICLMIWPLFRSRTTILTVQLGIGIGFALHYALLGAMTGALANLVGTAQISIALVLANSRIGRMFASILIGAMLVLPLMTWNGPTSLFAAAGSVLIALGRAHSQELMLRVLIIAGTACWLAHDILMMSLIAFIDTGSLVISMFGLWRLITHNNASDRERMSAGRLVPLK